MLANTKNAKRILVKLLGELCGKVKNNNKQQELDRIHCN